MVPKKLVLMSWGALDIAEPEDWVEGTCQENRAQEARALSGFAPRSLCSSSEVQDAAWSRG